MLGLEPPRGNSDWFLFPPVLFGSLRLIPLRHLEPQESSPFLALGSLFLRHSSASSLPELVRKRSRLVPNPGGRWHLHVPALTAPGGTGKSGSSAFTFYFQVHFPSLTSGCLAKEDQSSNSRLAVVLFPLCNSRFCPSAQLKVHLWLKMQSSVVPFSTVFNVSSFSFCVRFSYMFLRCIHITISSPHFLLGSIPFD